jgi:hypothetical protein
MKMILLQATVLILLVLSLWLIWQGVSTLQVNLSQGIRNITLGATFGVIGIFSWLRGVRGKKIVFRLRWMITLGIVTPLIISLPFLNELSETWLPWLSLITFILAGLTLLVFLALFIHQGSNQVLFGTVGPLVILHFTFILKTKTDSIFLSLLVFGLILMLAGGVYIIKNKTMQAV